MLRLLASGILMALALATHGENTCADQRSCTPKPDLGDVLLQRAPRREEKHIDLAEGEGARAASSELNGGKPALQSDHVNPENILENGVLTATRRNVVVDVFGKGGPLVIAFTGVTKWAGEGQSGEAAQWGKMLNANQGKRSSLVNGGNFVLLQPTKKRRRYGLEFAEAVLDLAAKYSNVNLTHPVTVYGSSAGCKFVHDLLMQTRRTEWTRFVCLYGQLDIRQKATFDKVTKKGRPLIGRTLWTLVGSRDAYVPPWGGKGMNGKTYISAEESDQAWANYFADGRNAEETTQHSTEATERTWLDGQVKEWSLEGKWHGDRPDIIYEKIAELVNLEA